MKRLIATYSIVFILFPAFTQDIRVGLFNDYIATAITIHCIQGSYEIISEGELVSELKEGDLIYLSKVSDLIRINSGIKVVGEFKELFFQDKTLRGKFRIKLVIPGVPPRNYNGDLKVGIHQNSLQLINETDFDSYLAGVVETEAGPVAHPEFYKAQAVLCRTYAVKNWKMYENQGFNLCDDTGCQAFKGISESNRDIMKAVLATHKMVVTTPYSELIQAAYHSNSGGETQKGDEFWPGEHPYLLPIIDPFSVDKRNYRWQETLGKQVWIGYLNAMGIDTETDDSLSLLIRQKHRMIRYPINGDTLSIPRVRSDFGFKSSFFTMTMTADSIRIDGKGYGHGVGLSQEGAMEMAEQGYSYEDIIRFYFFEIMIKNLNDLPLSVVPEEFR